MSAPNPISYESVPYHGVALATTHPDAMAALATLFDMAPAPVDRCRVLELGCATGVNLLAMAAGLPGSQFVGVDRSPRQIGLAQARAAALGLENISFHALDILDVDEALGQFDYIVAYGVFSWVPREVQERILEICRRQLAPVGVAQISYNTYPGWHLRGMVREMMLYHTRHLPDAEGRLVEARGLLDFLAGATEQLSGRRPGLGIYSQILRMEQANLRGRPDHYLAHDHLEGVNEPIYFSAFAERAAAHGLQYLGDVRLAQMLVSNLPEPIAAVVDAAAPDAIAAEQYLDFLFNRAFRQSLLVQGEAVLRRELRPAAMERFLFASELRRVENGPDDGLTRFRAAERATTISLRSPLTIAALDQLAASWPRPLPFAELLAAAERATPPAQRGADPAGALSDLLLRCFTVQTVELSTHAPDFVLAPGERPIASPLARLLVGQEEHAPTLRHETVELAPAAKLLLPLLDGSRDRAALLAALEEMAAAGRLAPAGGEDLGGLLERTLDELARAPLLLA